MAINEEFLNDDFLQCVVEDQINNSVAVLNITKSLFPVGENFNSELMRIEITYRGYGREDDEMLSMIAKYLPDDEFMIQFAKDMKYYEREMLMYEKTLSDLYSFGHLRTIAPIMYSSFTKPTLTLLLQDLSAINFKTVPRYEFLDLDHCRYVIDRLASFHASSVALYEKDSNSMTIYNQTIFADNEGMRKQLTRGFQELVEACRRYDQLKKYVNHLELIQENFLTMVLESSKASSKFNVLNHGDLWNNNIMFSYDSDGTIADVRFIDYQILHYTSPAVDLQYFLVVGASTDAKSGMIDLLRYYLRQLSRYLEDLEVKTASPTWSEFFEDFRTRIYHGLAACVLCLSVIKASKRSDANIINFIESEGKEGFRYHAFNNERYIKEITVMFALYDELGFFNH